MRAIKYDISKGMIGKGKRRREVEVSTTVCPYDINHERCVGSQSCRGCIGFVGIDETEREVYCKAYRINTPQELFDKYIK